VYALLHRYRCLKVREQPYELLKMYVVVFGPEAFTLIPMRLLLYVLYIMCEFLAAGYIVLAYRYIVNA